MASYAFVSAELKCPNCGIALTDIVWFQWGYCPGRLPRADYLYPVGDKLYWRPCADGSIRAWVFFDDGGGNIGDPSIRDLIVRDSGQTFLMRPCTSCGEVLGDAAVEIRGGAITRAWLAGSDEFSDPLGKVDVYTISDDVTRVPRRDFKDHPMGPATDLGITIDIREVP
jgi:hypothetical protein